MDRCNNEDDRKTDVSDAYHNSKQDQQISVIGLTNLPWQVFAILDTGRKALIIKTMIAFWMRLIMTPLAGVCGGLFPFFLLLRVTTSIL